MFLPAAIDRWVRVAAGPRPDPLLTVSSLRYQEEAAIPLDRPEEPHLSAWARYVQGVAGQLLRAGVTLRGTAAVLDGDLPGGAGLASSAALEVGIALTLLAGAGAALERRQIAHLAQRAEVEFVGVRCGIMDQLAVALGAEGAALLIDCRSLEISHVPIPSDLTLVVCDTGVRRTLGESVYNDRRRECDVTTHRLRRARHVVTENHRVLDAVEALRRGDGDEVGRLLDVSHARLRDDYEVSGPELDAMAEAARSAGALGARLTGAGFGGAVVALVARSAAAGGFVESAQVGYRKATGREGAFLLCQPSGGGDGRG